MNEEALRIRLQFTDKQRRQVGKRIRKYLPPAVLRRRRLTAWAVLAVYAGLLWLMYRFLSASSEAVYGNCFLFEVSEAEAEWCLEGAADAMHAQRNAFYTLLAGALLMVAYVHYCYASTWRSTFRSLNGRKFVYTIDPQGFVSEEADISRLYFPWTGVRQVVRDGDVLLIFVDKGVAYFVPLSAFFDQTEGERFFAQAKQWHAEAKHDQMFSS